MGKQKEKYDTKLVRAIIALIIFMIGMVIFFFPLTALAQQSNCSQGMHNYDVTTRNATEEEDGAAVYTCRICGFSFSRVLQATGHTWGNWIIDKQPTCSNSGHRYRSCTKHTNDQHRQEETIPAAGHQYKGTIIAPTCTEAGFKRYECERCGDSYTEAYQAASHHYVEVIIAEPDCSNAGEKAYTCEVCGDTYTEQYGEAAGHQYIEEIEKEADCEHDGEKRQICSSCGDIITSTIPALGHNYGEWIVDKRATEQEAGYQYKVCVHDENHIIGKTIPQIKKNTVSEERDHFPNQTDIAFIVALIVITAGFYKLISPDIYIIRWEKKKRITYEEWQKLYKR